MRSFGCDSKSPPFIFQRSNNSNERAAVANQTKTEWPPYFQEPIRLQVPVVRPQDGPLFLTNSWYKRYDLSLALLDVSKHIRLRGSFLVASTNTAFRIIGNSNTRASSAETYSATWAVRGGRHIYQVNSRQGSKPHHIPYARIRSSMYVRRVARFGGTQCIIQ